MDLTEIYEKMKSPEKLAEKRERHRIYAYKWFLKNREKHRLSSLKWYRKTHPKKPRPSNSWKGKKLPETWRLNIIKGAIGRKKNPDVGKNISLAKRGKPHYNQRGEKNGMWKGGISKLPNYMSFMVKRRKLRKIGNGGKHNLAEWENLKKEYNHACPCCLRQEPEIKLTIDHIIPISLGGKDSIDNIQPLCGSCNVKKHTKIIKYDRTRNIRENEVARIIN